MELSKEQKDMLAKLAARFFNAKQCAIVLQVSVSDLKKEMKNENSEVFKIYYGAQLKAELDLREGIFALAVRGSSPAQAQMLKISEQTSSANG